MQQLNPGACRSYLIAPEDTKEAVIALVLEEVNRYIDELKEKALELKYVIL